VSCSETSEQDTCLQNLNPILTYEILDTLCVDPALELNFNDLTSVISVVNQMFFSHYDSSQIYSVNLNSDSMTLEFDYSGLESDLIDFYLGEDLFLLTDYPYELIQYKRGIVQPNIVFSSKNNVHGYSSPFNGDKLQINEERKTFQLFMWTEREKSDPSLFRRSNLKGEIQNSFCVLPSLYNERVFPLLDSPSKLDIDSITLIGFGYEPHISKFNNISGELVGNYCTPSNYIKEAIDGIPRTGHANFQEEANEIIQSPFYLGLYHDPYKKIYYRIAKHGQDLKQNDFRLNTRYDGDWSIIVLDENLEVIGEVKMPSETFCYYSCFVGEKGLYVAFNNKIKKNAFALINVNYDKK
jgi:hypothetical protein